MTQFISDSKQIDFQKVSTFLETQAHIMHDSSYWQTVLPHSTRVFALTDEKNNIKGFMRLVDDGKNGMVYDVCVLPAYQKQKVGSLIMAHVSNYIHQHQLTFAGLVVVHENPSAKRFYEKFGFNPVSRVLQLYRDNIQLYRND